MNSGTLSVKRLFRRVTAGLLLSMAAVTVALFLMTKQRAVLLTGGILLLCSLVWLFVLMQALGKRLSLFTSELCRIKGISESNQAAVFRRFYRAEEVHGQQGAGIGLYLAREIVTRQGGYIKVVSKPKQGSVFSILLPVR